MTGPWSQRTNRHAGVLTHGGEPLGCSVLCIAALRVNRFRDFLGRVAAAHALDIVRVILGVDSVDQAGRRSCNNDLCGKSKDCECGGELGKHRVEEGIR